MEKIKHPMGEAMKKVAFLNKRIRIHPVLDMVVNFGVGGLIVNEFKMAKEISTRYDTCVKFEIYGKIMLVYPDTVIEDLYFLFRNSDATEITTKIN